MQENSPKTIKASDMRIVINLKEPVEKPLRDDLLKLVDAHLLRENLSFEERQALGRIKQKILLEFMYI